MIQVKVKKLPEKKDFEGLAAVATNMQAEMVAKDIKNFVKDIKCDEDHPTRLTITVTADKRNAVTLKKSGYCCKKFSDSVKIEK